MAGHNQKSPLPAAATPLASKGLGAASLLMVAWLTPYDRARSACTALRESLDRFVALMGG